MSTTSVDKKLQRGYENDVETGKETDASSQVSSQDEIALASDKALIRKQDLRIIPLCAGIYLLCYLDRSNIGNAKVLNADTGNDLLTETRMTEREYTIALMVFLIAYGLVSPRSSSRASN